MFILGLWKIVCSPKQATKIDDVLRKKILGRICEKQGRNNWIMQEMPSLFYSLWQSLKLRKFISPSSSFFFFFWSFDIKFGKFRQWVLLSTTTKNRQIPAIRHTNRLRPTACFRAWHYIYLKLKNVRNCRLVGGNNICSQTFTFCDSTSIIT